MFASRVVAIVEMMAMSIEIDQSLPPRLAEALRSCNLIVVSGAGISMTPPSDLPSWWGFNNALFEGIKACASEALPGQEALLNDLDLTGRMPVSAFSDLVVRTFAGDGYFPLLAALDCARPNANHTALARMAGQGIVSDIVTFNFDTLIEQAFRDSATSLEVLVNSADYERLDLEPRFGPRLHKVHGSVTDAKSLIDTVTQKLRGLSSQRRLQLASLFRRRHVLFLGFSGADFDFASDYLPMDANRDGGAGFTWLYRGTRPAIAAQLACDDGVFLSGSLPDFFIRMGIVTDTVPPTENGPVDIRNCIDSWTRQPWVGPWSCAALCQRLASEMGQDALARSLDNALAVQFAHEVRANHFDLTMGGVMRRLALSALESGDTDRALFWSANELRVYEAVHSLLSTDGREPSPGARLEYLRNTAAAYSNIGLAHAYGGRPGGREAARDAFSKAQAQLVNAEDPDTEALVLLSKAVHLETEADAKLRALRQARAHACAAGAGRTQIEAACAEAKLLCELSELDLAIEVGDSVEPLLSVAGTIKHTWQHVLIRVEICARRGNWDEGLTLCETALSEKRPESELAQTIAHNARRLLAFNADALERMKKFLAELGDDDEVSPRPLAIVVAETPTEQETTLRKAIAKAEMGQDQPRLVSLFEYLCALKYADHNADRVVDVALALRKAAQRVGDVRGLASAEQFLGMGYDLQGDFLSAAKAFRAAIVAAPAAGWAVGCLKANLAEVVWRQGDTAEAEHLFDEARSDLEKCEEWEQFAVATVKHGGCLVSAGRSAEAVALLNAVAESAAFKSGSKLGDGLRSMAALWGLEIGLPIARVATEKAEQSEASHQTMLSPHALGNLALREIELGATDSARSHIEAAIELYRQAKDVAGESRCYSNLATLHASLEDWPKAIVATRRALELRKQANDLEGQILILSNLANYLLNAGEYVESVNEARACLKLAPYGRPSWPIASARATLAQALCLLQRWGDAEVAVSAALDTLRTVEHPERDRVVSHVRGLASLLGEIEHEAQSYFDISPAAASIIAEAKAGTTPKQVAESLGKASQNTEFASVDRATIFGEYGNALVDLERYADAEVAYREAARLYEESEQPGMVWHTKCVMSTALRDAGNVDGAEVLMSTILRDCPIPQVRANLLAGYAKLIFLHRIDDRAAVENLRDRLRDAVAAGGVDAETLGRATVQLAQCEWFLDEPESARAMLGQAKALLVRSNSKLLPGLAELEAAYADPSQ